MAEIDALPFPLVFDPATTALIVIDMQRDFIEEGGFYATDLGARALGQPPPIDCSHCPEALQNDPDFCAVRPGMQSRWSFGRFP